MPSRERTVVLNQALADLAYAYLAMWMALDIYNPNRDRWSEPTDFGDAHRRRERAKAALEKVGAHDAVTNLTEDSRQLTEDIHRYRRALRELEGGGNFTAAKLKFSRELAATGNRLGHDSVSFAQHQSQGA